MKADVYLSVDLEFNASDRNHNGEIIEIGSALVTKGGESIRKFSQCVKPVNKPELTEYCSRLTGITQSEVSSAKTLKFVLRDWQMWLNRFKDYGELEFVCWGAADFKRLKGACEREGVPFPFTNFTNISRQFSKKFLDDGGRISLGKALRVMGIRHYEQLHRALSDAVAAGKLIPYVLGGDNE